MDMHDLEVRSNHLALQVSGEALLEPDASIIDVFRWFLTHESAHVYQNAAGMDGVPPADAWMHEGVANFMAHRIGGPLARIAGSAVLTRRHTLRLFPPGPAATGFIS